MNLKSTNVTAGKAAARAAKMKIGMYCVGMLMSPEILTHSSCQSHSSLADVALQLDRKNSHIRPENLSITHKFGSDEKTELDIGETG
jgi:hypothetical protein